jgi:hypothetical protein
MSDANPGRAKSKLPRGLHFLRILDTRFQLTILGIFLLYVGEIVFMLLWSTNSALSELRGLGVQGLQMNTTLVEQVTWNHVHSFLRGGALLTFIHCVIWMVVSNRVAGPLLRLQGELDRYADGEEVGNLTFRKEDYFTGLADSVESAIERKTKSK